MMLYLANGLLVVLTRKPVAPDELTLWLGGGMAIYGLFHFVRASWQEPDSRLGLSPAETLWISRAPLRQRELMAYRMASILPSTLVKALLVATVLYCDVPSLACLVLALIMAMGVLESLRLIADRLAASLSSRERTLMRIGFSTIGLALVMQMLVRTLVSSAGSSHPLSLLTAFTAACGETAGTPFVQWLAIPWWPMAKLAIAADTGASVFAYGSLSILVAVLSFVVVSWVDEWSTRHEMICERKRLDSPAYQSSRATRDPVAYQPIRRRKTLLALPNLRGVGPIMARQWVAVVRYRGSIAASLVAPAVLSLAPLVTQAHAGLLHVAAWLAVCTLLLAPPMLRIDFRRDIDRMWLLRSLPITPLAMMLGQIALPSMITIAFQLSVVATACFVVPASPSTIILVVGGLSGLAIFSFALENLVFLTFPHRPKQDGLAMMVRAKLVFLGKGLLLACMAAAFIVWVTLCANASASLAVLVGGCLIASWASAGAALLLATRCWRRFDIHFDTPFLH